MSNPAEYGALRPDGHMNTRTGKRLNIANPDPETICMEDIAYGIGYKPHYSGQTPHFFSVAQHSIIVARTVFRKTGDPTMGLVALMHDSEEAYIGDMITQIKLMFPEFKTLAKTVQKAIFSKFDLPFDLLPEIKWADVEVLHLEFAFFYVMSVSERKKFMKDNPIWDPMGPDESAREFDNLFKHYSNLKKVQMAVRNKIDNALKPPTNV